MPSFPSLVSLSIPIHLLLLSLLPTHSPGRTIAANCATDGDAKPPGVARSISVNVGSLGSGFIQEEGDRVSSQPVAVEKIDRPSIMNGDSDFPNLVKRMKIIRTKRPNYKNYI
ncbi:uncharacterized protein BO95DRAFT_445985 [Aspergillus brunneoviolaceus CBS 621.78]|uniref:Uncharacterized protein n=1 Tax=Aspergillus brunneoviolaceus CBS 621.78 TaxID=1450534 RepID=A0ACD1FZL8_9EURO|nr:hypothetical protein BO95DRAFT_445985 [Aspergillus brunneoviolaceus CBS 621.78]RAH42426.1 hypothetical protein BO95DRAFT_445985 [Aspergillus brunneoviolaceus CBS 621.78]